jgi:predicted Zn finger-like uncharacterized protein
LVKSGKLTKHLAHSAETDYAHAGGEFSSMPISVKCPECDAPYKVPDEAAGKAIKCKKCNAKISVPADGNGGDDAESAAEPKEKKKSGSGKMLMIVGGVLLGVSCLCCLPIGVGGYFVYQAYQQGKAAIGEIHDAVKKELEKGKGAVAGGATIFEKKETVTSKDPQFNGKPAKTYKVRLEAGKEYVIDMKAVNKNDGGDPYLFLMDPTGKEVAHDDDGGGFPDAQIRYTPAITGEFTIQATSFLGIPATGLPFTLTVKTMK